MVREIEIRRPDDWHVHLRDGLELNAVAPWTARTFRRAIIMPNLKSPITTTTLAKAYRERVMKACNKHPSFEPLMTIYLTDQTDPSDLLQGLKSGAVVAAKLYPAHATTNAALGVSDLKSIYPALEALSQAGAPLLVHAESAAADVDVFDREEVFLKTSLAQILKDFPRLRVVVEHITTSLAVDFVREHRARVAATITAHHLLFNRNAMFQGGFRPHFYCLPVAKREEHRRALVKAAVSGEECFFLGTDSAPHSRRAKESDCGCAGIFSSPTALNLYTQVFAEADRLTNLERFASLNGPRFYNLEPNSETIHLSRSPKQVAPSEIELGEGDRVVVFYGGQELPWTIS